MGLSDFLCSIVYLAFTGHTPYRPTPAYTFHLPVFPCTGLHKTSLGKTIRFHHMPTLTTPYTHHASLACFNLHDAADFPVIRAGRQLV